MQKTTFLECPAGHVVKKYKCLKPWQGWTHKQRCGICTVDIERTTCRWRCEEHCQYNVCEDCANEHWLGLIEQAGTMENSKRRKKLLSAVPQHLRDIPEYAAAENYRPPEEVTPEASAAAAAAKTAKGMKMIRFEEPPPESRCAGCGVKLQVAIWIALWLSASIVLALAIRKLLLDKALAFPGTLLMLGLSNIITYVLLQTTAILCRCCMTLGSDPGWRACSIFGLMRLMQMGFSITAMRSSMWYHNAMLMLYPVILFAGGVSNRSEKLGRIGVIPVVLAMAAGLMAVSAKGNFMAEVSSYTFVAFAYQTVSLILGMFRLMMTQNWLGMEDPYHRLEKSSPLVLATRMTPTVAIASFEFAFITGPSQSGGELGMLMAYFHPQVQKDWDILHLLCAIGVANAVLLVAELNILQLTSATTLGLLVPLCSMCIAFLPDVLPLLPSCAGCRVPLLILIGAFVYAAAIAIFIAAKCRSTPNGDAEANGYRLLEGGERRKEKKDRRGRSVEPGSPRKGGGLHMSDRRDQL